jgi:hypothetical protein
MDKLKNVTSREILCKTQQSSVAKSHKGIYFEIDPGIPTSCGATCRQTVAVLTNTGDKAAHNVRVHLDIYNSIGEIVYSTKEQLGDIPGGQSRSKTIIMNIDCGSILTLYSKCRKHMPLVLKVKIIFDEGVQTFPDCVYNTKF